MATFHVFDLIGERCEKNDDFQKDKQHIEGYTRFVMGAMFMKIIILLKKKITHVKILSDDNFFVQLNFRIQNLFRIFNSEIIFWDGSINLVENGSGRKYLQN